LAERRQPIPDWGRTEHGNDLTPAGDFDPFSSLRPPDPFAGVLAKFTHSDLRHVYAA